MVPLHAAMLVQVAGAFSNCELSQHDFKVQTVPNECQNHDLEKNFTHFILIHWVLIT